MSRPRSQKEPVQQPWWANDWPATWRADQLAAHDRREDEQRRAWDQRSEGGWLGHVSDQMDGRFDAHATADERAQVAAEGAPDPVTGQKVSPWLRRMADRMVPDDPPPSMPPGPTPEQVRAKLAVQRARREAREEVERQRNAAAAAVVRQLDRLDAAARAERERYAYDDPSVPLVEKLEAKLTGRPVERSSAEPSWARAVAKNRAKAKAAKVTAGEEAQIKELARELALAINGGDQRASAYDGWAQDDDGVWYEVDDDYGDAA